jgi:hypothetical protein
MRMSAIATYTACRISCRAAFSGTVVTFSVSIATLSCFLYFLHIKTTERSI